MINLEGEREGEGVKVSSRTFHGSPAGSCVSDDKWRPKRRLTGNVCPTSQHPAERKHSLFYFSLHLTMCVTRLCLWSFILSAASRCRQMVSVAPPVVPLSALFVLSALLSLRHPSESIDNTCMTCDACLEMGSVLQWRYWCSRLQSRPTSPRGTSLSYDHQYQNTKLLVCLYITLCK